MGFFVAVLIAFGYAIEYLMAYYLFTAFFGIIGGHIGATLMLIITAIVHIEYNIERR